MTDEMVTDSLLMARTIGIAMSVRAGISITGTASPHDPQPHKREAVIVQFGGAARQRDDQLRHVVVQV